MSENIISITTENALQAYRQADEPTKKLLENLFKGKVNFQKNKGSITECIKTYQDACEELNIPYGSLLVNEIQEALASDATSINAYCKLIIIARALNEGWKPDWNNSNEYKYYPYFRSSASGVGLSYDVCGRWGTATDVGSRLCYRTRELAEYAGKQFEKEYKELLEM